MSESKKAVLAYPRLGLAYFCQFAIWGAWSGALGSYAVSVLNFSTTNSGSLYNAIPFGALIAPLFIGPIADRYFSAQKVMSVLHLVGGLALLACGGLCYYGLPSFLESIGLFPILMGLMLLSGICYMPTMGLINSIVFKHLPNAGMAPYVFVWGTIGWIIVNLYIAGWCGGASTPYFFLVGGGVSLFLALYALTLPDTPPKGTPAPGETSTGGGLGVLSLFKSFPFFIFVVCAFVASIPACNYFFPAQVLFLSERGYPSPVALTTLNQLSEIALMVALPFCIARFGLKKVLLIGMAAWSIRYFCFAEPYFALVVMGLLLHGFCYTFLYVAAYMYAEKVAPAHLKASAQSMMVFLLLGVGQILGGYGYGEMGNRFPATFPATEIAVGGAQLELPEGQKLPDGVSEADFFVVPIPAWSAGEDSLFQYLDLAAQVDKWLGRTSTARSVDLGKLLGEQPLSPKSIDGMDRGKLVQDGVKISKTTRCCDTGKSSFVPFTANVQFTKDDLKRLGRAVAIKDVSILDDFSSTRTDDFTLTREEWLSTRAHGWRSIWQLPALCILGCFLIFFLLGRDPKDKTESPK